VGLLWLNDQPETENSTDNTRRFKETDIHAYSEFRIQRPSKRAAAYPRLDCAATGIGSSSSSSNDNKNIIIIIIIIIINEKSDAKQAGIQQTKARLGESVKKKWKNKVMHGQYIININRQLISEEDTFLWLSRGDLKAETESEIVAAQDQALQTKYYVTKILNTETDSKCRLCQQFSRQ